MKYAIMVLALVGVLARPTAAIAKETNTGGNQYLTLCTDDPGRCYLYAIGWRHGYFTAQVNAARLMELKSKAAQRAAFKLFDICIPQKVLNKQLGDVLIKYLQDRPEKRHKHIAHLAMASFMEAFPCR
uniref:Rap1a immunity protein domain-containing protein n=1 Tax=uncultured nuHF2 cluster bacterium HF0770_42C12 TaxID=723593 RepID=E7C809_9BACT|nr:hypothetical protein [uncultured nuHF2 cluster bacterium HF0770_42C12]